MTISDKKSRSSANRTALLWPRVNPEGDIRIGAQREKPSDNKNEAPTEPFSLHKGSEKIPKDEQIEHFTTDE